MSPLSLLIPSPFHLVLVLAALLLWSLRRAAPLPGPRWRIALAVMLLWAWIGSMPEAADRLTTAIEGPLAAAHACEPGPTGARSGNSKDGAAIPGEPMIVVLSSGEMWSQAGVVRVRLDQAGMARLLYAIRLWRELGGTLLLTGGPGPAASDSLAGAMRTIALDMGVAPGAILMSPTSHNTHEDLVDAMAQIAAHRGPVLLVTSALHMPRAQAVARRLGLSMRACPTDYRQIRPTWPPDLPLLDQWDVWLPHPSGAERMHAVLHEVIGHLIYRLRGWAE